MKKITFIFGFLLFMLCSCSTQSEDRAETTSTSTASPSTTEGSEISENEREDSLRALNSVSGVFLSKMEKYEKQIEISNNRIIELENSIKNMESDNSLAVVALILTILVGVFVIWIAKQFPKEIGNEVKKLNDRISQMSQKQQDLNSSNSEQIKKIEKRIQEIEKQVQKLVEVKSNLQQISKPSTDISKKKLDEPLVEPETPQGESKVFYCRTMNSKEKLIQQVDSQEEGMWKILTDDGKKGTFEAKSLERLRSSNGWEFAVEIEGTCSLKEAKNFVTIWHGSCKALSEERMWRVLDKTRISLS